MNYKGLVISVALILSSYSQAEPIAEVNQTAIYQKLNDILRIENSATTLNLAENMLAELTTYPLYPYAQFELLNAKAKQHQVEGLQLQQFKQQYPDLPNYFINTLTTNWLNGLVEQGKWQEIIQYQDLLNHSVAHACILTWADYKLSAKNTALFSQQQQQTIQQLWLTGQNLPDHCTDLVQLWHEQGNITEALIQQRAVLAFQEKNSNLLNQLTQLNKENDWIAGLRNLLRSPQQLGRFIAQQGYTKANQTIVLAAFPAFVRTVKATDLDANNPFNLYQTWADKYQLNPEQVKQWKSQLIWHIFDTDIVALQQWRDQQIKQLKEDRQTERRIRLAIRQQEALTAWLDLLSDEAKQKQEWRYWQAKTLQKQGKTTQAKQILTTLSEQRGFYPMLAATDLGNTYYPPMQGLKTTDINIAQEFNNELRRIHTLYQLGQRTHQQQINREWWALLARADFQQKLLLSDYATQQQWFDLAVEATIQAKSWSYLALRLPNAYLNWFDLQLKNSDKIHRTFAMAIARQESAWKTYAESHAQAQGLMQLLPTTAQATAQKYQLPYSRQSQLFDPFYNIMLGTAHLQELAERHGENRILIAAAYNAGSSRVDNWLSRSNGKLTMAEFIATIPFYETRGYVQNVLTYDYYYQILQQKPLIKFSKSEYDRLY